MEAHQTEGRWTGGGDGAGDCLPVTGGTGRKRGARRKRDRKRRQKWLRRRKMGEIKQRNDRKRW